MSKHATMYKDELKLKWEASAMPQNSGQNTQFKGPKGEVDTHTTLDHKLDH